MSFFKSFTGKILIVISFVFCLFTIQKINKLRTTEDRCLTIADGFGYYMYLPHLFDEGSLKMDHEWAQDIQNKYCDSCYAYQLAKRDNGNSIDIYHIGLSYVYLPSYAIGDVIARSSGYETDGFSTPYHVTFALNTLLFIFLGLLYFRKLLLLFVSDTTAGWTILLLYLGSNILMTFSHQPDLPHLYLFTLNAIFLFHFFKFWESKNKRNLIYAAIVFGLTTSVRPTQVLIGIIPLLFLIKEYGNTKEFWKSILLFPLFSIIWNIPQMMYWYFVGGELITPNLHTEDIVLVDPNLIDFLFSYRKGWLVYSPLFLLAPFGFYILYNKNRTLFWASLSFTSLYIYVLCSWETWYYASSFGSRVMVDIYPVVGLVIAIFLGSVSKRIWVGVVALFSLVCVSLNIFQSKQMELGYLHPERMTGEHYWYIFGKLKIDNYDESRLYIDKTSLAWFNYQKKFNSPNRKLVSKEIYKMKGTMRSKPTEDLTIGRITIFDLVETDETMFEVRITVKTTDASKSSTLKLEAVSPFNVYGWQAFEVSKGLSESEYTELIYKFNLPNVRHNDDEMQIYLDNDAYVSVSIKSFEIIAHSLIRK